MLLEEVIARIAHKGQKDKQGKPYIEHPERVAKSVHSGLSVRVAWLHDVLEDTDITPMDLLAYGVREAVVRSVFILTKQVGETYSMFIERICREHDFTAMVVKLADINDNLRPGNPSKKEIYLRAKSRIEQELYGFDKDQAVPA